MSREKLKPGQVLFRVTHSRVYRDPKIDTVTIKSVGRKWAKLDDGWRETKVDAETWIFPDDANGYNGALYADQQEWIDTVYKQKIWDRLKNLPYRAPLGIPLSDVQTAARLLGIAVAPPEE